MKRKGKLDDDFWLESEDDRLRRRIIRSSPKFKLEEEETAAKAKIQIPEKVTLTVPRIHLPNTVTIKLRPPKIAPIKKKLQPYIKKGQSLFETYKKWVIPAGIAVVLVFCLLLFLQFKPTKKPQTVTKPGSTQKKGAEQADFNPLISAKKKSEGQGKQDMKYDTEHKIVSYSEKFFSANLIISQQKLTDTAANDPGTLLKAADSIGAKQSVQTDKGTLFYVTVMDSTTQLGVFTYKGMMIFIRSDNKLDDSDWKEYVAGLIFVDTK